MKEMNGSKAETAAKPTETHDAGENSTKQRGWNGAYGLEGIRLGLMADGESTVMHAKGQCPIGLKNSHATAQKRIWDHEN